jgi:hypothetical protein
MTDQVKGEKTMPSHKTGTGEQPSPRYSESIREQAAFAGEWLAPRLELRSR